jgi:predicted signal transduction protein with EAL and GGDEF domain
MPRILKDMVKEIDIAMYAAKADGKNAIVFFPDLRSQSVENLLLEQRLFSSVGRS